MAGRKPPAASTAPAVTEDNTIDLDYTTHGMYYVKELPTLHGDLEINDTNSPKGKRKTQIYSVNSVDVKGKNTVFEYWAHDAISAEDHFR
jgi:hypothetical protein